MEVVFRTDASLQIGTGHIMRCLALADALREQGYECRFICRETPANLLDLIRRHGHAAVALPSSEAGSGGDVSVDDGSAHAGWLGTHWQADAEQTRAALGGAPVDWLVVDHYALDCRWEQHLRPVCRKLMVIDDLADRPHDCDLLLDQNLIADREHRYSGKVPAHCGLMLGPRYALLRPEFCRPANPAGRDPRRTVPRLLVMFGGADPGNLTLRTIKSLDRIGWRGDIDVVAGPLYPELEILKRVLTTLPNAKLHAPAGDVAALMHDADLAVGSPGVASWERCACALPSLTISQAWNQEKVGEALAEAGAHLYLGRAEDVSDAELDGALRLLQRNIFARQAMSHIAASVCDGCGVRRVVRQLLASILLVRRVRVDDSNLLFSWRNDERTRRQSFDPRPLALSSHVEWLAKTLHDADKSLLLVSRGERGVACVRFDCAQGVAKVSIYIDPDLHGHGMGTPALAAALNWLKENRPDVGVVQADVLGTNMVSQSLFLAAGFSPTRMRYELSLERNLRC